MPFFARATSWAFTLVIPSGNFVDSMNTPCTPSRTSPFKTSTTLVCGEYKAFPSSGTGSYDLIFLSPSYPTLAPVDITCTVNVPSGTSVDAVTSKSHVALTAVVRPFLAAPTVPPYALAISLFLKTLQGSGPFAAAGPAISPQVSAVTARTKTIRGRI